MLGKTLMTRRLDRSRDSLRNDINYHLCLIQHSPRKKRSVHSSVLPSILPVTTHSALLSSMLLVFAFWLWLGFGQGLTFSWNRGSRATRRICGSQLRNTVSSVLWRRQYHCPSYEKSCEWDRRQMVNSSPRSISCSYRLDDHMHIVSSYWLKERDLWQDILQIRLCRSPLERFRSIRSRFPSDLLISPASITQVPIKMGRGEEGNVPWR